MIVDEADLVTYVTDKHGNPVYDTNGQQKKNIDFDQFVYYNAVKCNRQEVGNIGDWQKGVEQYAAEGCGDVADLNCDMGKQWLALYTSKNSAKGDPSLANSLKFQNGTDSTPQGCSQGLHFFTYTYAADLSDQAYAFNGPEGGMYLFWDTDEMAYTASDFTTGQMALAGIGGLVTGILGTSLVVYGKKRKDDEPEAPAVA